MSDVTPLEIRAAVGRKPPLLNTSEPAVPRAVETKRQVAVPPETIRPGGMFQAVARIGRVVRRHGFAGSLRLAVARASRMAYLREAHIWYSLDLTQRDRRRRVSLPPGFTLINAGERDLALLEELPSVGVNEARRRLAAGVDLWIVVEGGHPAFCCWIFPHYLPAVAARGGRLHLPPGSVGLEDSVTSAHFRGKSVAPAAWSAIADSLAGEGVGAILTKVEETNLPCRRAIEKIGFCAVASMQFERIGGRSRVDLRAYDAGGAGPFLAEQLAR